MNTITIDPRATGARRLSEPVAYVLSAAIIGFALFGALGGDSQMLTTPHGQRPVWIQNAALIYVPFIAVFGIAAWFMLKSIPVRANFREQLDIFKLKHAFFMTTLYIMTFGSFAGFAATFPLLIKTLYGHFPGAPDPLAYAFLGPLVGSIARVVPASRLCISVIAAGRRAMPTIARSWKRCGNGAWASSASPGSCVCLARR